MEEQGEKKESAERIRRWVKRACKQQKKKKHKKRQQRAEGGKTTQKGIGEEGKQRRQRRANVDKREESGSEHEAR
jgi:hypothetical protein